MKRLVLSLLSLQLALSSCPDGYNLVRDGQCRGFAAKMTTSYEEAFDKTLAECSKVEGKPVVIHNEEQQNYWMARKEMIDSRIIIGIVCNTTSKHVEWIDGSPVDYIPPDGGIDDMNYCYSGCSWNLAADGHWHSLCGDLTAETVMFCTKQLAQPVPSADGCDGFEDDDEDGVCYQIGTAAQNWQDAQKTCREFGADLASIHSSKENTFVRRLAVSKGAVNGLLLGGQASGELYGWSDGSDWDYDNFKSGYPLAGLGDCISMDTQSTAGEWVNTNCSSSLAIACKRQPIKEHTCFTGPWTEGQIITSPGFPFDASTLCDYTFTVAPGKRVEVEVIFLEANTCCDKMILYEGDTVLSNITGEINSKVYKTKLSNIMRVSWQPNGGVNVQGMMITYRAV